MLPVSCDLTTVRTADPTAGPRIERRGCTSPSCGPHVASKLRSHHGPHSGPYYCWADRGEDDHAITTEFEAMGIERIFKERCSEFGSLLLGNVLVLSVIIASTAVIPQMYQKTFALVAALVGFLAMAASAVGTFFCKKSAYMDMERTPANRIMTAGFGVCLSVLGIWCVRHLLIAQL